MPLTILQYITPSRLAGAEYFFLRVVAHLAQKGHRVIVVTKRDTPLRAEVEKLLPLGVELHAWHTHGKIDPKTLSRLCHLIRDEKVDLINTHLTTASWQGALAGKLTGVPVVAVVHATDRKTWFQHADRLIAVSSGVKDALIDQGVPASKIEVLYHGIDLSRYVVPLSTPDAKVRLGLPADAKTVGVAASLIPRKGHRFLLEALTQVEAKIGPVHALFAGEGELEAELKAQVNELGLSGRVHFLGFRRDVAEVMCAMDIFALPSLKEGLSIAVMEAQALQKPVVVTNIAGMPEVVRDGHTGLLVPPGDVPSLAHALESIWNQPEYGHQLGRDARDFLEENFDQRRCLDTMEAYFRRVVLDYKHPRPKAKPTAPPAVLQPQGKRALRVVQIIAPSKIAGAERSTISLCRGLATRGNRVWLLIKDGQPMIDVAAREGVDVSPMRIGGKLNLFAVGRLIRWTRRHHVDLIATQLSTASLWGSITAKIIGVPCVATVRALNTKTCYVFADRIIVVSEAVKAHLVNQGISPEKIRVVYNGIDLKQFQPVVNLVEAKRNLGYDKDALIVGVLAHLTKKKGHRWFLEAAAQVTKQIPNVKFLLVGDGVEREPLETYANALGCQEHIIFTGFQDDVLPWLAAMDALVLPTIEKEGFGRVLVEAGALEKPVISTDVGGMAEVVADGETGYVVPAGEVAAMTGALLQLLGDQDLRERMGRAGRARALAQFSVEHMIAGTEAVYHEVLDEWAHKSAFKGIEDTSFARKDEPRHELE